MLDTFLHVLTSHSTFLIPNIILYSDRMHTKDGYGPVNDRASSILQQNVLRHMRQRTKKYGWSSHFGPQNTSWNPVGTFVGSVPAGCAVRHKFKCLCAVCTISYYYYEHEFKPANHRKGHIIIIICVWLCAIICVRNNTVVVYQVYLCIVPILVGNIIICGGVDFSAKRYFTRLGRPSTGRRW